MNSILDKIKKLYHIYQRIFKFYRRFGLKNSSFTIISNNCTAGYVYQFFGLPYRTPTAGVFFEASDYVKLVKDPLCYFTYAKLEFIEPSTSKNIKLFQNSSNWGNYPVARLNDIEIYFMHYKDQKSAENIWYRRSQRINMDNLLFLFTENESFTRQVVEDFLSINNTKN